MTKCFRLFYGILFLLLIIHVGSGQASVSSAPESQDFSPEILKKLADIVYTIPFQNMEICFFFENDQFKVKAPNGKISALDGPENGIWTNPKNGNRIFFETDSQGKVLLNLIVNTFFSKVDDTE